MFWNNFVKLCNKNNTTPTTIVKELNISIGSITRWKNGSIPNDTTLLKIATYFGVSKNYLLENNEEENNMFWERFSKICSENNTSPTAVAKALHIGIGSITKWKNGTVPRGTTLSKLSDYFGVSTDYLLGTSNVKSMSTTDDTELNEYLEELKIRPEMKTLFSLTKGATKEEVEQAIAIIEALQKVKENNG